MVEIGGIGKSGVHALASDRAHDMSGIAAEQHPPAEIAFCQAALRTEMALKQRRGGGQVDPGSPGHLLHYRCGRRRFLRRGLQRHLNDPAPPSPGQREGFNRSVGSEIESCLRAPFGLVLEVSHEKTGVVIMAGEGDSKMVPDGAAVSVASHYIGRRRV